MKIDLKRSRDPFVRSWVAKQAMIETRRKQNKSKKLLWFKAFTGNISKIVAKCKNKKTTNKSKPKNKPKIDFPADIDFEFMQEVYHKQILDSNGADSGEQLDLEAVLDNNFDKIGSGNYEFEDDEVYLEESFGSLLSEDEFDQSEDIFNRALLYETHILLDEEDEDTKDELESILSAQIVTDSSEEEEESQRFPDLLEEDSDNSSDEELPVPTGNAYIDMSFISDFNESMTIATTMWRPFEIHSPQRMMNILEIPAIYVSSE